MNNLRTMKLMLALLASTAGHSALAAEKPLHWRPSAVLRYDKV